MQGLGFSNHVFAPNTNELDVFLMKTAESILRHFIKEDNSESYVNSANDDIWPRRATVSVKVNLEKKPRAKAFLLLGLDLWGLKQVHVLAISLFLLKAVQNLFVTKVTACFSVT